jgi:hypothetical protein
MSATHLVRTIRAAHSARFPRAPKGLGPKWTAQIEELKRLRDNQYTLARLGQKFGVTRERIRQLLALQDQPTPSPTVEITFQVPLMPEKEMPPESKNPAQAPALAPSAELEYIKDDLEYVKDPLYLPGDPQQLQSLLRNRIRLDA